MTSPAKAIKGSGSQSNMDVDYVIVFRFAETRKYLQITI